MSVPDFLEGGDQREEIARLRRENATLRAERDRALGYVRGKVDQLLGVLGTVPLRPEELDDNHLLDLDPIGIVAESFSQVLEHLHQTNEELRNTHGDLQAVYDSAAVGIVVVDREARILSHNRAAAESLLVRGEDAEGRRCFEVVCGCPGIPAGCSLERVLASGRPIRRNDWHFRGRQYDVVATPVTDPGGEVTHVVTAYLDITERELALSALRESEERYRDLFEHANDLIQSVSPDGSILFVNRAWRETLGYSEEEVRGLSIFQVIAPDCLDHCGRLFRAILAGEDVGRIDVAFRAKDGRRIVVEGSVNCNFVDGKPVATRGIFRDVTEQRQMEEEVARSQKLESLGLLAGGIAHDFNNLLAAILSNLALARLRRDDPDGVAAKVGEAEGAALRARDLTQQLLTFSRGGAPVREMVSVAELIRESVAFALTGSNVKSHLSLAPDLWSARLDPGQISRVIQNLVINADQAMPEGGPLWVRCRNREVDEVDRLPLSPGDYVEIEVEDRGVGIPAEHLERIFDPYFTTKVEGSGLGLATAHSIIRRHGGHLAVSSSPGRGAAFHLYLPATRTRQPQPERDDASRSSAAAGRVLLMDDEEIIREATGELLEMMGYRVETAPEGGEALESYRRAAAEGEPFDVVLMDLTVPGGMGGKEATSRLLALDASARIVATSGYSNDPVMAEFRRHGFAAVLPKPYNVDALAQVLRSVLETRGPA